jgi:hypothetical protein
LEGNALRGTGFKWKGLSREEVGMTTGPPDPDKGKGLGPFIFPTTVPPMFYIECITMTIVSTLVFLKQSHGD